MDKELIENIADALAASEICPFAREDCIDNCHKHFSNWLDNHDKQIRADAIDDVKHQMISFHTDMIFRYGADTIEARCDAFNELEAWIKEQK